ncbi:MAG TPA: hypothetical protein VGI39_36680 [Polyangiaceae bacterium]
MIVASPPAAGLPAAPPELTIMARNPFNDDVRMSTAPRHPGPLHCGPAPDDGSSPIDALTALWSGGATLDGQRRDDCPAFPAKLSAEGPQIAERPCGPAACPNQQVAFGEGGVRVHVLFYDDPSQHRPERAKEAPSGACYYRVYAVSVAWDGKGPQ